MTDNPWPSAIARWNDQQAMIAQINALEKHREHKPVFTYGTNRVTSKQIKPYHLQSVGAFWFKALSLLSGPVLLWVLFGGWK